MILIKLFNILIFELFYYYTTYKLFCKYEKYKRLLYIYDFFDFCN